MPRAASVWLDVLPSMAQFRRELRQQLEDPVRQSASRAGEQGGEGLMSGMAGKMKAGALAAGAAAGVLVAKGIGLEMEKAAASGKLKASLGLSAKDAQKAGNAAGRLYANGVTESISEGAESVKAIMSAGLAPTGATTKQLAEIATKTQDLSTLFEVDLGQAANAAGQAVKTGLAKNAGEALDTMTRGFQVMGPRADDLADTFNEYSTIFRSLNLPIKTVTGLLAQGMAAGARDTDVVADALKEFQIRATDGSTASAAGFKALGLSAKGMTSQIAKGGKGASDGLQTVLDRLRKMKDPVDRNAAAVALFGTKAEDMGKALYSLDPKTATDSLGKVGGAAKKAGDDLRDNAGAKFEQFKRKALMAIGEAAARYALPPLMRFANFLLNDVLPPVRTVAGWLGDHLAPALRTTGEVISGTVRWFQEWGIWLSPLAVLIGGVTLALSAQAIVTGTVTAVFSVYRAALLIGTTVTGGFAAAQAALNAVMALNPFVLVAIALVALGVALVVAYKKSATFRAIVQAAFDGVKTAGLAVFHWFAGPFVGFFTKTIPGAFQSVLSWVGSNWPWILGALTGPIGLAVVWVIKHWDQVRAGMASVWGAIKRTVLYPIRDFFTKTIPGWGSTLRDRLVGSFDSAQAGIKRGWDKVRAIAKAPVAFIIDTVYNKGIVPVWNKVASVFGAPTLKEFHPKGFARGGLLPGQSSYRGGDDQLVPMRRGEGVYVSEAMRDPFERARLHAVNKAAMQGRSLSSFQGGGFSKGGIFGWVSSAASKGVDLVKGGVDWLKDGIKDSALAGLNGIVKPLIEKISGSSSIYRDMISGIPQRMIKDILGFSDTADKKLSAAGIGGKGYKSGLAWARTQNGKPYQWGGNGNPSWDCSGLVSAIESVIRGEKPHRRWATGSFSGANAPAGWVLNKKSPYMIGVTNSGVGHTAGTLNGVNVESRGGDGVVIGSGARSYRDGLFTHHYGFTGKGYADGGKPRAGEIAWVGEQGPELVKFRGGEEVYNSRDSLRMWEGAGARGFAKGTSASAKAATKAARKDLPGDLKDFTKSLSGSASDIAKAAKELIKDLKAAGVGGKTLAASVGKASDKLQSLAKQRDALAGRIAVARSAAADQKKTAKDYIGLSNLTDATSITDVLGGMAQRQATVASFQATIKSLTKKGLSKDLIGQLVAMGPDSTLAGTLSGASASQIKQLNAAGKHGAKLSTSYGRTMADSMYDAGKASGQGFLAGLLADEKAIRKAMAQIGAGAIKAIRSKKGIDAHSPSRKGKKAGADLGAGLVEGMTAAGPSIESAAARMASGAVPAGVVPVTSGSSAQTAAGGIAGQPLYLVVEDGTILRAYVSDQVDDALTDVRRAKRSGKK